MNNDIENYFEKNWDLNLVLYSLPVSNFMGGTTASLIHVSDINEH